MTDFKLRVGGLDELINSIRRVDATVAHGLNAELKAIAQDIAERVRSYIIGQGLYDPERAPTQATGTAGAGPMVDKVSIRVYAGRIYVVERQRRRSKGYPGGYDYPKRYEYENGGARSFMRPALAAEKPLLEAKLRAWLDRMIAQARW